MTNELFNQLFTVVTAIIGVAILAVIVSKNSNTTGVITASSQAFSGALGTALSPVTGSSAGIGSLGITGGFTPGD